MKPKEEPAKCAACGIALLPLSVRRLGAFLGVELGFALLFAAATVPSWWARVLCGSGGVVLLVGAHAAASACNVALCPRCKTGPSRTRRGSAAAGDVDARPGGSPGAADASIFDVDRSPARSSPS